MTALLAGIRIVYVEDDDDMREVWEQALTALGATVTSVSSARAALDAVAHADIVLTDFALPVQDGVWLQEQVNQRPRPVPVIAVTGYAESQVLRLSQARFARVLLKPVDSRQVAEVIREIIRGPEPP